VTMAVGLTLLPWILSRCQ